MVRKLQPPHHRRRWPISSSFRGDLRAARAPSLREIALFRALIRASSSKVFYKQLHFFNGFQYFGDIPLVALFTTYRKRQFAEWREFDARFKLQHVFLLVQTK